MTTETQTKVKDPVCGMEIKASEAAGQREFQGETFYFCSESCLAQFEAKPAQYATTSTAEASSVEQTPEPAAASSTDSADGNERCDLPILGMHCAACATRIEKALNKAPGVRSAGVNYATGRATVHYDAGATDVDKLRAAVQGVGYDAIVAEKSTADVSAGENAAPESVAEVEAQAREKEYQRQKRQFIIALVLTIPVAFMAMAGHLIPALQDALDFPGRVWLELALTTPVLFWAGREFFTGAWIAAKHRAADMNTLVAIGTFAAYAYSVVATVAPHLLAPAARTRSAHDAMNMSGPGVYYEVAAMVITLILMGTFCKRAPTRRPAARFALDGFAGQNRARRTRRAGTEIPIDEGSCGRYRLGASRRKNSG